MTVKKREIGNLYGDFQIGQVFKHHWGRTISQSDNILFTTLTMHFNPLYFNKEYAMRFQHSDTVINPMLVFHVVLGLTVEDLSEAARGPFLGVENVVFHTPVYPGDTLYAESRVVEKRESKSRPEFGIVTWVTAGKKGNGNVAITYIRRNLVAKERREPEPQNKEDK